jgi:hypothetical protein
MLVSDMTIDCGAQEGSSWECKPVVLVGQHDNRIERVRATNGSAVNNETMQLWIMDGVSGGWNNSITDSIVDNCYQKRDINNPGLGYCTCICIGGGYDYTRNVEVADYNSLVANNYTDKSCQLGMTMWAANGLTIKNNYFDDNQTIRFGARGISHDTGTLVGTKIQNNVFYNPSIAIVIGGPLWDGNGTDGLTVENNYMEVDGNSTGFIYLVYKNKNSIIRHNIVRANIGSAHNFSVMQPSEGTPGNENIVWEDNVFPTGARFLPYTSLSIFRIFKDSNSYWGNIFNVKGDGSFDTLHVGGYEVATKGGVPEDDNVTNLTVVADHDWGVQLVLRSILHAAGYWSLGTGNPVTGDNGTLNFWNLEPNYTPGHNGIKMTLDQWGNLNVPAGGSFRVNNVPLQQSINTVQDDNTTALVCNGYYMALYSRNFTLPAITSDLASGCKICVRNYNGVSASFVVHPSAGQSLEPSAKMAYCATGQSVVTSGAVTDELCYIAITSGHWNLWESNGAVACQ